jgi:hypothetical protein
MSEHLVRIRVLGPRELVDLVVSELQGVPRIRVVNVSPPYSNRKDEGVRRYLDVLADDEMVERLQVVAEKISHVR